MKFYLLLYCLTHPADAHPNYDCVSVSVHMEKQTAINAAHDWCVFDHVCIHHTYLQEVDTSHENMSKVPKPHDCDSGLD